MSAGKTTLLLLSVLLALSLPGSGQAGYRHKKLFADRFVHQPVASEDCTACHGMHFPEAAGQLTTPVPGLCLACHEDPSSGKAVVHRPVAEGNCLQCHYPHSSPVGGLLKSGTERLCSGCHPGKAGGRHGSATFEQSCTTCHDPHSSNGKGLLKGTGGGDCRQCHRTVAGRQYIHTPAEGGRCPQCHDPHAETPVPTTPCKDCHEELLAGTMVHEPAADGCGECHFSHSSTRPDLLVQSPQALCLECHTEMSTGRHGAMEVGRDCTRCHDPHSSEGRALLKASVRRGPCASCHVEVILKKVPHTPVGTNRCERCHDPHSEPAVPTALCRDCHGGIMDGRYDHEAASDDCGNCHDPHGSDRADGLVLPLPELCTDCHDEMEDGRHGDVLLSDLCTDCHDPHSALQPHLLTLLKERADCKACHVSQGVGKVVHTPVEDSECGECHDPHSEPPVPTAACLDCHGELEEGPFLHEAMEEGCSACHVSHTGALRELLVSAMPGLCLECHDEKEGGNHGSTTLSEDCRSCHEPHSSTKKGLLRILADRSCTSCHTDMRAGQYVHSALEGYECEECHDPHASPPVMPPMACQSCHPDMAERSSSHGAPARDRCLECHDPHSAASLSSVQFTDRGGRGECLECHRDIARKLRVERVIHAPVTGTSCPKCHTDHTGETPFTRRPFSATKYTPYDPEAYALCFSCHPASLVQVKYTETDTGFRQRRWNLHNLHVIRDGERGFSCRVCHDAHASGQDHLVKREAAGRSVYKLRITFREREDGGECITNCHTVKEYAR